MGILCIKNNRIVNIQHEIPVKMPNPAQMPSPIIIQVNENRLWGKKLIKKHYDVIISECKFMLRNSLKYEPIKIRHRKIFETIVTMYKQFIYFDKTHILDEFDKNDINYIFYHNNFIQYNEKNIEESNIYLEIGIWPYFDEKNARTNHIIAIKKSNIRAKKDKKMREKQIQHENQVREAYQSGFSNGKEYYQSRHRSYSD
jgi:hypothetical protein